MEIRVLGCYGGMDEHHRLTSFLIDGFFAIDAGAITGALSSEAQHAITDVLITHSHLDHTSSLAFLIDNVFGEVEEPLRIYGHGEVLRDLHLHVFNDVSWPDFTRLPSPEKPTIRYVELPPGKECSIGRFRVMPVWVNHVVPTTGLIVTEDGKSWVYSSDTANTDEIWARVNELDDPRLLFLECSFPNRHADLADSSKHLTPAGVGQQLAKLNRQIPVRVYHGKPSYLDEIMNDLRELNYPDLELLRQDEVYTV
jgi:ribonuclease BN (tRNA processing enzyme)